MSMSIIDALDDPAVFAPLLRSSSTWSSWRAFLCALFALDMSDDECAVYQTCTGRSDLPISPASEAWLVIGRRGGKSFVLALIAVFLASFRDWRPHLAPGERATVMVIAADRKQARVILRYVKGILSGVPMLAATVEAERQEAVDLRHSVSIEVHSASYRTTRGYTVVAALCDEIAFWPAEDSASPDAEIVAALRPAMATVPGAMLLCASSPYARRGVLFDAWRRYYGRPASPILVWQAPTRTMNPMVPQRLIDEAYERDPSSAEAEYGAQFRTDVESFVSREAVEACLAHGTVERAPLPKTRYVAFCDPSGGSADSFTLAIAHRGPDGHAVLDAVRERRPPFSPEQVVEEYSALLKSYGLRKVRGDRYGGEWPREQFRKHGVTYEPSPKPKSDIYVDALPMLNSGRASLLDLPKLVAQLVGLERRVGRSGRDSIDHGPGAHDDVANAATGALVMCGRGVSRYTEAIMNNVSGPGDRRIPYLLRHTVATGRTLF